MLFTALVLVAVDCEHDRLQKSIDFGHGDEATEVGDVPRLRLEQEEQVSILLCLLVVGEEAFLQFGGIVEVVGDFVLLGKWVRPGLSRWFRRSRAYLFQGHAVLDKQCYPRVEVTDVLFEDEVLLGLRGDLGFEFAQYFLGWRGGSVCGEWHGVAGRARTSGKVVFDLQVLVFGRHGQVEGRHRVALRLAHGARAIVRRHCVLAGDGDEGGRGGGRGARGSVEHGDGHGGGGRRGLGGCGGMLVQ